ESEAAHRVSDDDTVPGQELGVLDEVVVAPTVGELGGHHCVGLGGVLAALCLTGLGPPPVCVLALFGGEVAAHRTVERTRRSAVCLDGVGGVVVLDGLSDVVCGLGGSLLVLVHLVVSVILSPRASAASRISCRRCWIDRKSTRLNSS